MSRLIPSRYSSSEVDQRRRAYSFAETVGAAPVEYLINWRMALAKDALLRGRGTLDEIADAIGYKSASAFSTAFSHRVGCPPRDYASTLGNGVAGQAVPP